MKIKPATIARTAVLALALVNQVLTAIGISPIPVEDGLIENLIATAFTIATAGWAWWKNNSFTKAAIEADEVMEALRDSDKLAEEVEETEENNKG